jgi:thiamine-monophosphate kinase
METASLRIQEDRIIEQIKRRIPSAEAGDLRLGIGDDAAVIRTRRGEWVVTCDQFLENVHFVATRQPADSVGYKALTRATSDVFAMGGRPRFFLLSMALPASRTGRWLEQMISGMARAARDFGLRLAGGDTARVERDISLNITVIGEIETGWVIGRAGARAGDGIYVTGRLGGAELGLRLLNRNGTMRARDRALLRPHFYPRLPVEFALWLGRKRMASAMMDISDGLSTDLSRLCARSRVAARIYARRIPKVSVPKALRNDPKFDPLTLALHGGEDYGLLFTAAPRHAKQIPARLGGTQVHCIGEIIAGSGVMMVEEDGTARELRPAGWDHFAVHSRRGER